MKTTLNQIRKHSPCHNGWTQLLRSLNKTQPDDEPLWIDEILDHNGISDALWCLRSVEGCEREIRLYALWCARRVQHLITDPISIAALNVVEQSVHGEASAEDVASARVAARVAAQVAAHAAARAVAAEMTAWVVEAVAHPSAWVGVVPWVEPEAVAAAAEVARAESARVERAAQAEELRRICREMRNAEEVKA